MSFEMPQVDKNDIGGDRHEDENHRAFAGGRTVFSAIDSYEDGPAASSHGSNAARNEERL